MDVENTGLGKADITAVSNAIKDGKLSSLCKLHLGKNSLHHLENDIKLLYETAIDTYKQNMIEIHVSLDDVTTFEEFKEEISTLCKGTMVSFTWSRDPWVLWGRQIQEVLQKKAQKE